MGRKRGVTKCVPNEKRRRDEKDYSFPGGTSLTFKEPFCSSCTSVSFSSTPPRSQTTNIVREPGGLGGFISTWQQLWKSVDLK